MKILRVTASMDPAYGGPPHGIRASIRAMAALGVENEVVCCDAPDAGWIGRDAFPLHALGPGRLGRQLVFGQAAEAWCWGRLRWRCRRGGTRCTDRGRLRRRRCRRTARRGRLAVHVEQGRQGVEDLMTAATTHPAFRDLQLVFDDLEDRATVDASGRQAHKARLCH